VVVSSSKLRASDARRCAGGQVLMSRPREEWVHDVRSRYRALENFTQEDARLQFLRILRSLPYGALGAAHP